jgi:hypothetical protein
MDCRSGHCARQCFPHFKKGNKKDCEHDGLAGTMIKADLLLFVASFGQIEII